MHEIGYFVYDLSGYLVIFPNGVRLKRVYDLSEKNLKMKTRVYDLSRTAGVRLKCEGTVVNRLKLVKLSRTTDTNSYCTYLASVIQCKKKDVWTSSFF